LLFMFGEALVYSLALGLVINLVLYVLVYTWLGTPESIPAFANTVWGHVRGTSVQHLSEQIWIYPGLNSSGASQTFTGIALSLGAGLFEEFAFRVVLLTVLLTALRLILRPAWAAIFAIPLAAMAFSLAHYVGALGEPLQLHSMLFRFFAGLLFTLLYYARGFAITAYAHAMYDIWVLLI